MTATAMTQTRHAVVVGLGQTGFSCVRYLCAQGYRVTVVDSRAQPPRLHELRAQYPDVIAHTGGLDAQILAQADLLVVSPGIALREPAIAAAQARGVQAVGDVEIFAQVARAPVLAITGANGKSTVTSLVGAMCEAAGLNTIVGGNIGVPVLDLLDAAVPDVYVLELSSFQLETTHSLKPHAATVLNLTPDHMDRYRDLAEYAAAKARIFHGDGLMVLNRDDPETLRMLRTGRPVRTFGLDTPPHDDDYGVVIHGGEEWLVRGARKLVAAKELPLPGRHNAANVLAAMALVAALDVPFDAMVRAALSFRGLKHRTQLVAEIDGVQFIDDSKGTNVGATVAALSGMTAPAILIAGGDGKGQDFAPLQAAVAAHTRAVVLIGRDGALIAQALNAAVPIHFAADMDAAVARARELAQPGDVVLLSPACASFDMFKNYEHRGQVFAQAVQRLRGAKRV